MTITLRLDPELQDALDQAARQAGMTRSAFVRECIQEVLEGRKQQATPWELGKDLFGRYGSSRNDLSTNRKQILKEKMRARKGSR